MWNRESKKSATLNTRAVVEPELASDTMNGRADVEPEVASVTLN